MSFAGYWGPEAILYSTTGDPARATQVEVREDVTNTLAVLYIDRNKTVTVANPTKTDILGNLSFYADAGFYHVSVVGTSQFFLVEVRGDSADDPAVVHTSGAESIAGAKTFQESPIIPNPSSSNHAASRNYVDSAVSAGVGMAPDATTSAKGIVRLAGDLGGTASSPTVPLLAAKADDSAVVHKSGIETVTGAKEFTASVVTNVTGASSPGTLPAGYGNSTGVTGLKVASSYPSDDVSGGTDGTGRLNLYSYQRANAYSFGEIMRIFSMRKDAKQMIAWYAPEGGYDSVTRDPVAGSSWKPVTWVGTHWESNGHNGNHKHWEVEIPDSSGALQGRLEIPFGNASDENIGLDGTQIQTNLADLVVRCTGTNTVNASAMHFVVRLSGAAGNEKAIEFANDVDGVNRRFKLRVTNEAESTGGAGSNFQIVRYDDAGTLVGQPLIVRRSDGLVTIGGQSGGEGGLQVSSTAGIGTTPGTTPLSVQRAANGTVVQASQTLAGATSSVYTAIAPTTAKAFQSQVSGDALARFSVGIDGKIELGDGTATRDTNLYRSAADTLKTDDSLVVGGSLTVSGVAVSAPPVTQPTDLGYQSWSYDPIGCRAGQVLTAGVLYLARVQIRQAVSLSTIYLGMTTPGSTLTAGQNFVGLYNSTGTLVGSSADQSSSWTTGGVEKVIALSSSAAVTPGFYWVGILANGTTPPTLAVGTQLISNLGGAAAGASARRFGAFGTAQTALPTSFTPSSVTALTNQTYWVAVG